MAAYEIEAVVHGSGDLLEPRQSRMKTATHHWRSCARGKRHVFFGDARDADELGAGDSLLENACDEDDLYAVVAHEMWRAFMAEVVKAGLTVATYARAGDVREELAGLRDEVQDWSARNRGLSATEHQDWVRFRLLFCLYDLTLPVVVLAALVDCLVRAAAAVREGGAPVFAVEAGRDCFFVTSYWPTAMRQALFAGVPVAVRSAGGLTYEVIAGEGAEPRLSLV